MLFCSYIHYCFIYHLGATGGDISPALSHDSSDSRSDESQSSVVNKIEAMAVQDIDTDCGQSPGEVYTSQGPTGARVGQTHTEALLSQGHSDVCSIKDEQDEPVQCNNHEEDMECNHHDKKVTLDNSATIENSEKLKDNNQSLQTCREKGEPVRSDECDSTMEVSDEREIYNPLEPTRYIEASRTVSPDRSVTDTVPTECSSVGSADNQSEIAHKSEQSSDVSRTGDSRRDNSVSSVTTDELHHDSDSDINFDRDSYAAERSHIRNTVSAAVQSLREQNLAPVVSLQYSTESTLAGTIRVGFTHFQSLEDEIAEQNPGLVISRNHNREQELDESAESETEGVRRSVERENNGDVPIEGTSTVLEANCDTSASNETDVNKDVRSESRESHDRTNIGDINEIKDNKLGACAINEMEQGGLKPFCPIELEKQNEEKLCSGKRTDMDEDSDGSNNSGIDDDNEDTCKNNQTVVAGVKTSKLEDPSIQSGALEDKQVDTCVESQNNEQESLNESSGIAASNHEIADIGGKPGPSEIKELGSDSQGGSGLRVVVSDDSEATTSLSDTGATTNPGKTFVWTKII